MCCEFKPFVGRFQELPPEGPLADLAWNQPEDVDGWQLPPRAAGLLYGSCTVAYVDAPPSGCLPDKISLCCAAVTADWLDKHGFDLLVTTSGLVMEVRCMMYHTWGSLMVHQQQQGFKCMHDGRLLQLWSAPNYCNRCGNLAAVLCVREHAAGPHSMYISPTERPAPSDLQSYLCVCVRMRACVCVCVLAYVCVHRVTYSRAPSLPLPVGREPLLRT